MRQSIISASPFTKSPRQGPSSHATVVGLGPRSEDSLTGPETCRCKYHRGARLDMAAGVRRIDRPVSDARAAGSTS